MAMDRKIYECKPNHLYCYFRNTSDENGQRGSKLHQSMLFISPLYFDVTRCFHPRDIISCSFILKDLGYPSVPRCIQRRGSGNIILPVSFADFMNNFHTTHNYEILSMFNYRNTNFSYYISFILNYSGDFLKQIKYHSEIY